MLKINYNYKLNEIKEEVLVLIVIVETKCSEISFL